jgi:hypothetical protein
MTREQFERFVEAVEKLIRSDFAEVKRRWREEQDPKEQREREKQDLKDLEDLDGLKATFRKIEEERLQWARDAATEAAQDKVTWVPPVPLLAYHLPPDLALWFVEAAKRFLSGEEESLDRAFGLIRPRGRPFDPETSANLDIAEEAFRLKYECRRSWKRVLNEINEKWKRPQPIDERTIRKMIESHLPAIYRRRAKALTGRLPKIPPIERE